MLPVEVISGIKTCGSFATERKYDIHCGIDLYCTPDSPVVSLSSGIVIDVFQFTGAAVGSEWWNDTYAITIQFDNVIIVYGELQPLVSIGQKVVVGQCIGNILPVLKKDKGKTSTSMLHLETWTLKGYIKNFTWLKDTPKPDGLINPLTILPSDWNGYWVIKTLSGYKLEYNDGTYIKLFSMPSDCKAYCLSNNIQYKYISPKSSNYDKVQYTISTMKILWFEDDINGW